MRELERRITKLEEAGGPRLPPSGSDEAYFAAFEREELRYSFARMQFDIATDCPSLLLNREHLRAEVAEQDARLEELLGGRADTPEQAEADRETVWRWEAARTPEERELAHLRRWPDKPTFADLLAEYQALYDAQPAEAVQPAAEGSAA